MSKVKPFKALRPIKEKVEMFACPPYDVLEDEEVRNIVSQKPESFLRVTRAEVDFEKEVDSHSEEVYKKASENLKHYEENGLIFEEDKPCYYVYRETWREKTQTGLFAVASSEEYDEGRIKKHEFTREEKEDDRTKHINILGAQTGPVFLTFKSKKEIKDLLNEFIERYELLYSFTDENQVKHELWKVDQNDDLNKLENLFNEVDNLYIADGHHRAAAAARIRRLKMAENPNHNGNEEYNFFLAAIFPHDELRVLDYNRIVKDLNGNDEIDFISKIEENFILCEIPNEAYSPDKVHEFGMYLNNKWYKLKAREEIIDSSDPVKELDVYILQEYLLDKVLGIKNPRKDSRIHFIGGIRGVKVLEDWIDNKDWKVAFSLFPTPLEQLIKVADDDKVMPPKSTWFEPKLRSGLVIHKI